MLYLVVIHIITYASLRVALWRWAGTVTGGVRMGVLYCGVGGCLGEAFIGSEAILLHQLCNYGHACLQRNAAGAVAL